MKGKKNKERKKIRNERRKKGSWKERKKERRKKKEGKRKKKKKDGERKKERKERREKGRREKRKKECEGPWHSGFVAERRGAARSPSAVPSAGGGRARPWPGGLGVLGLRCTRGIRRAVRSD